MCLPHLGMVFIVIGVLACNTWYALPVLKQEGEGSPNTESLPSMLDVKKISESALTCACA